MAAEGKVFSRLCLITCSRVLGKCSNFKRCPHILNGGKKFGKGCFKGGKTFFFRQRFSVLRASDFFPRRFKPAKMFRSKCAKCRATRSKSRFVGCEEEIFCRKCYHRLRRGLASTEDGESSPAAVQSTSTSTEGGKSLYKILVTLFKLPSSVFFSFW